MNRRRAFFLVVVLLAAVAVSAAAPPAYADYLAYAVVKSGEEVPLPEDVQAIAKKNAKKLVEVKWGEYSGKKIRIGVLEANNESSAASYSFDGPQGSYSWSASSNMDQIPVSGIDAILTDVLARTERFRVLERTELDAVLDEQDLGDSGRVAKPSAAAIGKVLGAQYLIKIVVNSYEPGVSKKKGGLGGFSRKLKAVGGIKAGKEKSYVAMTFKLIDAETSEVVASEVVEATISDLSLDLGGVGWGAAGALGGFMSSYAKTPVGQAVIACVNAGVFEVVKQVGNLPMSGTVVAVKDPHVILNLGQNAVSVGDQLMAKAKGESFVDPETGLELGAEEEDLGLLKVTKVQEKLSYAEPVGFDLSRLSRGDKVVSTKAPESLEFGAPW